MYRETSLATAASSRQHSHVATLTRAALTNPCVMPLLSLRADAGVGAIAVSPSARDAVLAGRSGLYVVDLQQPLALPRWLPLRSAWEVASVEWCPSLETRIVSSSNQKALVWNLALPSDRAVEHVLHGHRRAVSDVDFSRIEPPLLATASIDSTIKVWDLRALRRGGQNSAVHSFTEFDAGALQARWNPLDLNQVASAHNNRIVVWDRRKFNVPYASIVAHESEVNGVQFLADGRVLSCSTDGTVKLWDWRNDCSTPVLTVNAGFPVWRALPTPFELGAALLPLRREFGVQLVNLAQSESVVPLAQARVGTLAHPAPVKDAVYFRHAGASQYAVATWSRDAQLRIWDGKPMLELPHARSAAGCKDTQLPPLPHLPSLNTAEFDAPRAAGLGFSLPGMHAAPEPVEQLDWIAGVDLHVETREPEIDAPMPSPGVFTQELETIAQKFPRVELADVSPGGCRLALLGPWSELRALTTITVDVTVPPLYPSQPLTLEIHTGPDTDDSALAGVRAGVVAACTELSEHSAPQVEVCVRFLVGDNPSVGEALAYHGRAELATPSEGDEPAVTLAPPTDTPNIALLPPSPLPSPDVMDEVSDVSGLDALELAGHAPIDSTPLPKNSGAVWSKTGKLVCFFNRRTALRERGPLPLDKVFAEADDSDDGSAAPFLSDSDDFDVDSSQKWSAALRMSSKIGLNPLAAFGGRARSRTLTTMSSDREAESVQGSAQEQQVLVRDFVHLWPSRPDVAAEYRNDVNGHPLIVAEHNLAVAERFELEDDARLWRLLVEYVKMEIIKRSSDLRHESSSLNSPVFDWGSGFLGLRSLVPRIAHELERQNNVQMLACLACLLSMIRAYRGRCMRDTSRQSRPRAHRNVKLSSTYTSLIKLPHKGGNRIRRAATTRPQALVHSPGVSILSVRLQTPNVVDGWGEWDPNECQRWIERSTEYREQYAELLHMWGLDIQRSEVLKLSWDDPLMLAFRGVLEWPIQRDVALEVSVSSHVAQCALCCRPVMRLFKSCLKCLHALHSECAHRWWKSADECPSACGCACKEFAECL